MNTEELDLRDVILAQGILATKLLSILDTQGIEGLRYRLKELIEESLAIKK